jgi:uncharacterized protein (DUF1697 family)
MPVYVALLRGINLGPHKRMNMEKLRESFAALGFERVQTYIQSGNVVFQAGRVSQAALRKQIEEKILRDFGFPAPVITRTQQELGWAMENNPFLRRRSIDLTRLHLIFLADAPRPSALKELEGLTVLPDESCCAGKEIYLHLPNGMGRSSLTNNPVERRHLKAATTRNWNTVTQLYEMCLACG